MGTSWQAVRPPSADCAPRSIYDAGFDAMTDFPDSGQLDLFEHSRAVILANNVIDALLARDAALSTARFNGLCIEEPGHRACEALQTLCRALGEWPKIGRAHV